MPRAWSARIRRLRSTASSLAVAPARQRLAQLDQRLELVGLEDRRDVLEDRGHAG